ncbi:MAG: glycosyltransferase family 2 protein [Gammaproteobacteria bacterium]|nr:glycosyltransferase family 2 protein [Gammaproteobacteria bacterium]
MNSISVIIITRNEAHDIVRCLKSVSFADEIIVLDSGSTDDTVALAQQYTPHVFSTDWPGYGIQKQRALDKATGDWVISLDADEVVSEALANKIKLLKNDAEFDAYKIHYESYFLGKKVRFGPNKNEYHLRLARRNKVHFSQDSVHEGMKVSGPAGIIRESILHYSYRNLEEVNAKIKTYSLDGANKLLSKGRSANFLTVLVHSGWAFLKNYVLLLGFLDGLAGYKVARMKATECYQRYTRLMILSK